MKDSPGYERRLLCSIKAPAPTALINKTISNRPHSELAGTGTVHAGMPMGTLAQPVTSSQLSAVQKSPSSQFRGAIGWQTPTVHSSAPLHTSPSRQGTPSSRSSVGQLTSSPVHVSAGSQTPVELRHSVAADSKPSAGQLTPEPVHVSATSQMSAAARHSVAADSKPSAGQLAPEPVHWGRVFRFRV